MNRQDFKVEVAAQNGKPQRLVSVVRTDGTSFRDQVNVSSAISRDRFLNRVARKFEKAAGEFDWLDDELTVLSDEADLEADEAIDELTSQESKNQATLLVELAASIELFHDQDEEAFARFAVNDHFEVSGLRTRQFRRWLSRQFYVAHRKVPGSQALQDAINTLEGKAIYEGELRQVSVRLAELDDRIYLDLCNSQWQVIEISAQGWQVLDQSPVMFRRAKAMLPLPRPVPGGVIDELRKFINMSDEDWTLFLAWLVAALRPTGPYPVLSIQGEHGSGKSSACEIARNLVDPNSAALRSEPREPRDLMIASKNSWVLAFDNLSGIKSWQSDCLCRIATGGGFSTRTLYENDEETIFNAQRPIVVNGIEEVATRADLLDRCLLLNLPRIDKRRRRPKKELDAEFEQAKPRILGALLSAVVTAIRNFPSVSLAELPRMADFALWATAAEEGLNLSNGQFMRAYQASRDNAVAASLEASPVGKVLVTFVERHGEWCGTATELLELLESLAGEKQTRQRSWPVNPVKLSSAVKRLAPNLRDLGIEVEHGRTGQSRWISLRSMEPHSGVTAVTGVTSVDDVGDASDAPERLHSDGGELFDTSPTWEDSGF